MNIVLACYSSVEKADKISESYCNWFLLHFGLTIHSYPRIWMEKIDMFWVILCLHSKQKWQSAWPDAKLHPYQCLGSIKANISWIFQNFHVGDCIFNAWEQRNHKNHPSCNPFFSLKSLFLRWASHVIHFYEGKCMQKQEFVRKFCSYPIEVFIGLICVKFVKKLSFSAPQKFISYFLIFSLNEYCFGMLFKCRNSRQNFRIILQQVHTAFRVGNTQLSLFLNGKNWHVLSHVMPV